MRVGEAYPLGALASPESEQDQVQTTRSKERVVVETSCLSSDLEPRPSALVFSQHTAPLPGIPELSRHHTTAPSTQHRITLSLILVTFTLGLIIDQHGGLAGQLAVGAWTWGVFFWLLRTSPSEWRLSFYA